MKRLHFRIKRIHRASDRAIAKFLTTEQRLAKQNDALTEAITEINDEIIRLNEIRLAAESRRSENAGIMRRIKRIISGDAV